VVSRDKIELAATLVGVVAGAWKALEERLEAVTVAVSEIGARLPRIKDPELALAMARGLDALLCNIAVGHNALAIAIGDGLVALETGRRAMDLKYSNIGDYAREELGLNASTATKMARLARRLRDRAPCAASRLRSAPWTSGAAVASATARRPPSRGPTASHSRRRSRSNA